MYKLLIAGAGAFGREVLDWALDVPASNRDWEIYGFLDLQQGTIRARGREFPVFADSAEFKFTGQERVVCAIGDPKMKLACCRQLKARGAPFTSLIHPTVVIGSDTRWGEGCILCPGVVLTNNVTLGNFVTLNLHSTVGHDAVLGDGCTLSPQTSVSGWCRLGEGVVMGCSAVVIPKICVADYTVVGAASVVIRSTRSHATVFGVPAVEVFSKKES